MLHIYDKLKKNILPKMKSTNGAITTLSIFALTIIFGAYVYKDYNLIAQVIYSIVFFLAFLIPGYAIFTLKCCSNFDVKEKFVYSFGISFLIYATFMIASGSLFSGTNLCLVNLIFFFIINSGGIYFIHENSPLDKVDVKSKQDIAWVSTFFLLFILFLQIFVSLPFSIPENLQDGPYVFKDKNSTHIKIQALTGNLPADNYIPYVFSQFLLQELSFEKNRPMLPGQEVSNRTVLMGLNSAYFLSIFRMPEVSKNSTLGTFSYVGTNWPDVGTLGKDNKSFSLFMTIAMLMNGLFLLAVYLLICRFFGHNKGFGIVLILMVFPYVINQVIFTWPKFLMAYFLISALYLVHKKSNPYLIGLFLALSFHSHPSAVVYVGFIVLYWAATNLSFYKKNDYLELFKMLLASFLSVLPWIIWTKFIVKIPSDLITQNLATNDYSLKSLMKIRLENLYLLFTLGKIQFDYSAHNFFDKMVFTFVGAIGVYFVIAYFYIIRYLKKYYKEVILLFLGPIIVLTLPWGKVMGCFSILFAQPSMPIFFSFAVMFFLKYRRISVVLLSIQVVISIYALWFGMYNISLQIVKNDMTSFLLILAMLLQVMFIFFGGRNILSKITNNES